MTEIANDLPLLVSSQFVTHSLRHQHVDPFDRQKKFSFRRLFVRRCRRPRDVPSAAPRRFQPTGRDLLRSPGCQIVHAGDGSKEPVHAVRSRLCEPNDHGC